MTCRTIRQFIFLITFLTGIVKLDAQDTLTIPPDTIEGPLDSVEIAEFLDQVIVDLMEEMNVPGVTFSMVRGDSLLYKKGYGKANIEEDRLFDPDLTPTFVGSVSKLFTSTAIMQLYEQGKVELDVDVNNYLSGFMIDKNYDEPVTIKNLLTHTGGFEERSLLLGTTKQEDKLSTYEYVSLGKQPRVMPPGKYLSYSNYGMTLLGYIVQEVSGTPFNQYIKDNILDPLEMTNSGFGYPERLMENVAMSYRYNARKQKYNPLPVVYVNVEPAGSLLSTAENMSHFMIAHLQLGRYKDTTILEEETARLMHSQLFTQHPKMNGWCYGFIEGSRNGVHWIEHPGDIGAYSTRLIIIPEKDIGLFVSVNGVYGFISKFREELMDRFMDHYYPADDPSLEEHVEYLVKDDLKRFEGTYRMNRYSRLSFEKIMGGALEGRFKAESDHSLTLYVSPIMQEPPSEWNRVGDLLFRHEDGRYMAFYEDNEGRITHSNFYFMVPGNYIKMPWYAAGSFHLILLLVLLVLFLSVMPGWPVRSIFRKIGRRKKERTRLETRIRTATLITIGLHWLFLAGLIVALIFSAEQLAHGTPVLFAAVFTLPIIAGLFTLYLLVSLVTVWNIRFWYIARRIYQTFIVSGSVVFLWILYHWNFLGYNF